MLCSLPPPIWGEGKTQDSRVHGLIPIYMVVMNENLGAGEARGLSLLPVDKKPGADYLISKVSQAPSVNENNPNAYFRGFIGGSKD